MKVYIATKFQNQDQFHKLKRMLENSGHTITHDWTKESDLGLDYPAKYAYRQKCAIKDIGAVVESDVLVLIPVEKDQPMVGAFVELGAALSLPIRVIVVDAFGPNRQDNIFYYLPEIEHVNTIEEAAQSIGLDIWKTS